VELWVEDILGTNDYTGYRLSPNSLEEGWLFAIVSNTNDSITIEPVTNGIDTFDLTNVTFDGNEIFLILPPEHIGGAGGGGSGAELTGTIKTVFQSPWEIPGWICGAGAGAGGGVLMVESARSINVATSGRVYAEGGRGGSISGITLTVPGGGGGGGGSLLFRAGEDIKFSEDSIISVLGGAGGGVGALGGDGGSGFMRLENFSGNLKPSNYANTTYPPVSEMNMGVFPAQEGESLAMSKFYFMGISRPNYIYDPNNPDPESRGLKVVYDMVEVDDLGVETPYENLIYPDTDPGAPFPYVPGENPILFTLTFNSCPADDDGFLDLASVTDTFIPYESFDDHDRNPYIRFKMILKSSAEIETFPGSGIFYTYKNLKIRSIAIDRDQI
jgi:hypothetical protein